MMEEHENFGRHPSKRLQKAFKERPFQMQVPEKAKIILLGLDANWDYNIDDDKVFFNEVLVYLSDGVKYWKDNGIHSPLLKDSYKKSGKRYHQRFKKLGLTSKYAEDICFLELLNVCTYGSSREENDKIELENMIMGKENKNHLAQIRELAKMGKMIYLSASVIKINKKLKLGLFDTNSKNIKKHLHFSYPYMKDENLKNLGKEIIEHLNKERR